MDLSIIVVSYNVEVYLLGCLESIYKHPPRVDFEVIVVDNASVDSSADAVRAAFPQATLIESRENLGFAGGNNLGLAHSTGRYVLLLNPDTEVAEGTLDGMVRFADAHPEVSVFTCRLLNPDGTLQYSCFHFTNLRMVLYGFFPLVPMDSVANGRYPREMFEQVFEPEHILGAYLMVRREVLEAAGGLDERYFMFYEETDLCYRLAKAGHRRLYTPEYAVVHHGGRSTSQYREEMSVAFARSQAYFFRKNYGLLPFLALKGVVVAGLAFWTLRSAQSLVRRRIDCALFRKRLASYARILAIIGAPRGDDPAIEIAAMGSEADLRRLVVADEGRLRCPLPRFQSPGQSNSGGARPLVSIVIPNWNGAHHLPVCLNALRAQTYPALEVIVADNASTDGSRELLAAQYPEVRLAALDVNRGFTGASNAGMRAARGEIVILLNNDTEPDAGWVAALVDAFVRHPEAGIVASKIRLMSRRDTLHAAGDVFRTDGTAGNRGVWQRDDGQFDVEEYVFSACGGAAAYRRAMLDRIGLLDDRFFFSLEDVDLAWRAQLSGWRCVYTPAAVVYHALGATGGGPTASFYTARNLFYIIAKDWPAPLLRRYGGKIVASQLRSSWAALRQIRGREARATLRGQLAGLAGLPRMLGQRRAVQRSRTVTVEYLESVLTRAQAEEPS